ncbi:unnamed protein product, partial [Ectocarpus fasciculatus]
ADEPPAGSGGGNRGRRPPGDRTMVDTYLGPLQHQRRGGRHLTTDFVGQSSIEDADYEDSGDALTSFVSPDLLLESDELGRVSPWGLHGYPRYSRLPRGVIDRIANGPVLGEAEEATKKRVLELAGEMDGLCSSDGEEAGKFADVAFDEQGWATKLLEMADAAFADDGVKHTRARELVEDMERRTRGVVNQGAVLMKAVSRAIHLRLAEEARRVFDGKQPSIVGGLRRAHHCTMATEGAIDRLLEGHMDTLIEDVEASSNQKKRKEAKLEAGFKAALKRRVKEDHDRRKKEAEQRNVVITRENAAIVREEDKKALVECEPPVFAWRDIALMSTPPCLLRTFWSARNVVSRSGHGWVHALSRNKKAAPTGRSVGRESGTAQYRRVDGTPRSETGVSTLAVNGVRKMVVECQEGEDCKAVFVVNHRVDRAYRAHAQ